ncbi:MAG: hypothetical protein IKL97_05750 [Eggerthellaceae bacterium]|nr:hypothetical protein [Eggerthellaceae bacterium]
MSERFAIAKSDAMQARSAEDYADAASLWARKNRRTWHSLCRLLRKEARNRSRWVYKRRNGAVVRDRRGLPVVAYMAPVRRGDIFIIAQMQGMSITMAREFRFDNNMWATLSRMAIMYDPSIAHVVNPRTDESLDINHIDLKAIWQRHNPLDDFYADTWQEAAEMRNDFLRVNWL